MLGRRQVNTERLSYSRFGQHGQRIEISLQLLERPIALLVPLKLGSLVQNLEKREALVGRSGDKSVGAVSTNGLTQVLMNDKSG